MTHVSHSFSSAALVWAAPGWAPAYFVGAPSLALRAGAEGETVSALGGRIMEGWRVSETPGVLSHDPRAKDTPIYRQSNIGRLRLEPSACHWDSPRIAEQWCVKPGDVILNKLAPVRAALVSPAARRHPVDGNSLIVRDLPWATATWLAVCLNSSAFEQLLLLESGILKRVGIGTLAEFRIPPVPPALEDLALKLRDLLDDLLLVGESIQRARDEAADFAATTRTTTVDLRAGSFFEPSALTDDSWVPAAVALRALHATLADTGEWAALSALASSRERNRLPSTPDNARALRLGDVGEDLFIPAPPENGSEGASLNARRLMAGPLIPGEVLVSTLGTSFRPVYVDEAIPAHIFPTDGWVRLRFRETPAAWALLLSTETVRTQVARLAIGSAQQFVPPGALSHIRLPVPAQAQRGRWQRLVERHHAHRRDLERRWSALTTALGHLVATVLESSNPTPRGVQEAER